MKVLGPLLSQPGNFISQEVSFRQLPNSSWQGQIADNYIAGDTTFMISGSVAVAKRCKVKAKMWAGIRQEISPVILCMATCLVVLSILLLTTVELLRRRSEKLRGISRQ